MQYRTFGYTVNSLLQYSSPVLQENAENIKDFIDLAISTSNLFEKVNSLGHLLLTSTFEINMKIGTYYTFLGYDYAVALKFYKRSLDIMHEIIREKENLNVKKQLVAKLMYFLAVNYEKKGDLDEALYYFNQILTCNLEIEPQIYMAKV